MRAIHQQYEANPLVVWLRMLAQFFLSLLSAVGLGVMAALYPVYAVTPSAALEALRWQWERCDWCSGLVLMCW